jgi:toxin-antitoxin system PIN domain toxin
LIAVDTNILVYAHRQDSPWHMQAATCLRQVAEGDASWALPWPCVHEFLSIVTHPRIYSPPTAAQRALDQVSDWFRAPGLVLIGETSGYWDVLQRLIKEAKIAGPRVHDARVAALCVHHGVTELWTADRDFSRFPEVSARNPLVALQA